MPQPDPTESMSLAWRLRIAHARAGTRVVIALVASALTALALRGHLDSASAFVASWDAFAFVGLLLTWTTILTLEPEQIRRVASVEDPSRVGSMILVVLGATASLLAVTVLLQASMTMLEGERLRAITLGLSAVALAWTLIHTVFTIRYAHLFYDQHWHETALEFPGGNSTPDYLDFAYFAFIIGMTAQTADVNIRSRRVRRIALVHGIISFAFNTAVVALSIGVLTTLL